MLAQIFAKPEGLNTFAADTAALESVIAAAGDAQVIVYTGWTFNFAWPDWRTPYVPNDSPTYSISYAKAVADQFNLKLLPVGDVLDRLRLENGSEGLPTLAAMYRDPIHMSYNPLGGQFMAHYAVLTTVTGENLTGTPIHPDWLVSPSLANSLQQVVWDVLANHPLGTVRTAPGDADGDDDVDLMDLNYWKTHFGKQVSYAADWSGNGEVDAADYTIWVDNFDGALAEAVTVPEQPSVLLLVLSLALLSSKRSTFNHWLN